MVNGWEVDERWAAPGRLEPVRRFLNTWELRAAGRDVVDRLPELATAPRSWQRLLTEVPLPAPDEIRELQELRAALRRTVDQPPVTEQILASWFERHPIVARVARNHSSSPVIRLEAADTRACDHLLADVAAAINDKTWTRLRACLDCRLVFFDRSRNRSRRWCGMYAGSNGRSCGSIAKVQRWRDRHN